ncbi:MAG TPA: flagellar FlbD family protein [Solirubrobacteraceae bacterium]|jgi:flagellar protein FlbD|nr:flagellar FlbD family protein [Solirubrobacteraceae bacterium]
MISLHRLGHQAEEFHLNPDLIVTVEANPDTVITLTTGTKVVVAEPPERVVEEIRAYRVGVLSGALGRRRQEGQQPHGIHARRAAQGMLLAIDRSDSESDGDDEDEQI